jgi:hypothetical protein
MMTDDEVVNLALKTIWRQKMPVEKVFDECKTFDIRQFSTGDKIYVRGFDLRTSISLTRQYGISIEDAKHAYQNGFAPIEQLVISVRYDEQPSMEKE